MRHVACLIVLVKNTSHAPDRLFVGVAPRKHIGEGSDMGSETKIFNLNSDEFGTNPPFSKKCPAISILQYTFWWEQSEFFLLLGGKFLVAFWWELEL
jgi:hypothetical protein